MQANPILIIDDDEDDLNIMKDVVASLQVTRPVQFFTHCRELETFLQKASVAPFLIICDLNLPEKEGCGLQEFIAQHQNIRFKGIPLIYWSTDASEKQIQQAYDMPAQGFFFKPNNFRDLCETFQTILNYWQISRHPKRVY